MTGRLYHPLRLTAAARPMVFGGHAIAQHLGRSGLPDWAMTRSTPAEAATAFSSSKASWSHSVMTILTWPYPSSYSFVACP